jgi:hypothetical protein
MIVDAHTHVFPPKVIAQRDRIAAAEPAFAEIYGDGRARMATADELIASMDEAGVDVSVVCNFAWRDEGLVDHTNAYILDAAARSGGRLVPYVSVYFPPDAGAHGRADTEEAPQTAKADVRAAVRALAAGGARGIGELRPEHSGYDLGNSDEADLLNWAASAFDLALLVHASEPVGHQYAGKAGGPLDAIVRFAANAAGVTVVAAHWGGGLPFYALMPEVRDALASTYFDTSAGHLLYEPRVYRAAIDLVGADRILWASDWPLTSQAKALARLDAAGLTPAERTAIAGENAARVLRL